MKPVYSPEHPEKADQVIAKGSPVVFLCCRLCQQADLIFTMVGFPDDVRQVYLSQEGIIKPCQAGNSAGRHDHNKSGAFR